MRTSDPNVIAQAIFGHASGGSYYQATQHHGVYIGYVTDTHTNNPQIPKGTVAFSIPRINPNSSWTPSPYPGVVDPPLGTQCIVAFEGMFGDAPRVLAFTDWQAPVITVSATDPIATYTPTTGDLWIEP